jgi:peptide subunit release factor 1 (eRF1)
VHAERERAVGVLLVRLGAHAAGVFEGPRLVDSKVARRLVHGRHRAGGSSARRFERRRGEQARASLGAAADLAARLLLPRLGELDAVVFGGDRRALAEVLEDRRLRALAERAEARVLEVPEPRLDVLRATPAAFRACALYDGPPSSST